MNCFPRGMSRYAVCGALCLMSALGLSLSGCSSPQESKQIPPPLVRVISLEAKDVMLPGSFVGQAAGSLSVQVRAQVGGILKKRNYKEGDYVKQGQLLFEIDPDTYRAAYNQAKSKEAQAAAALDNARRDWDRIQPLYAKNAVSQRDRDTAQTAYNGALADHDAAKAATAEAKIKLDYAYVVAPISGYTSKESWTEGNLITIAGDAGLLTEINEIDPIFVDFSIPSTELQRIRQLIGAGKAESAPVTPAEIEFADGGLYAQKGVVNFLDTKVDTRTSTVKARAVFPNPDRIVLPGQFVRVNLSGVKLKNALLIPQTSIIQTQKGTFVMVLDDKNLPQSRLVKISTGIGNDFVVEEGLVPGDRIVAGGVNKIRPGQPIRIADAEGGQAASGPASGAAPGSTSGAASGAASGAGASPATGEKTSGGR